MAKRRKRTNANIPAKGRLRDMADQLWSLAVRADWNFRCAVCGAGGIDPHHIVPRQHEATRYDLWNGIGLCPRHHRFDRDIAPHQNAAGWLAWLHDYQYGRWLWLQDNFRPKFDGVKNVDHYIGHIRRLRQYVDDSDYLRIVGAKFADWLDEQGEDE